jgi:hypothetical protein
LYSARICGARRYNFVSSLSSVRIFRTLNAARICGTRTQMCEWCVISGCWMCSDLWCTHKCTGLSVVCYLSSVRIFLTLYSARICDMCTAVPTCERSVSIFGLEAVEKHLAVMLVNVAQVTSGVLSLACCVLWPGWCNPARTMSIIDRGAPEQTDVYLCSTGRNNSSPAITRTCWTISITDRGTPKHTNSCLTTHRLYNQCWGIRTCWTMSMTDRGM